MTEVRQCKCGDLDCIEWMRWQEAEDTKYPHGDHQPRQTPWWWPFPQSWWRW